MALSVTPVANLAAGQFIAGILDSQGATMSRLFSYTPYTGSPPVAGGAQAPTVPPNGITGFPTVAATPILITAPDASAGNVGMVQVTLAPNASDVVNASSPQVLRTSPQALAIVASTSTQ